MKKARILPFILCFLMTASLLAGCAADKTAGASGIAAVVTPSDALVPPIEPAPHQFRTAASYDEVYSALLSATQASSGVRYGANTSAVAERGAATAPVPAPAVDSGASAGSSATASGYSQTNVQVQGVDEGDIAKTDGQYIYVLRQNELIIFKADGTATARVSSLKVGGDSTGNKPIVRSSQDAPDQDSYISETATDVYVAGDMAVVVSSYSSYVPLPYAADTGAADGSAKPAIAPNNSTQIAKVYIIDISDKTKPALKAMLGQDGAVLTSRLIGSTLYLISNYYVYSMQEGDSGTYVPKLYAGDTAAAVSYSRIGIMPYVNAASYTVVCAYDVAKGILQANQSLLGGGTTVYMNTNALYIAGSTNAQTAGTPYTDSVYTVIDYTTTSVTDITCFDVTGGGLNIKASGTVPGSLYGQFALDAFNGNLRVVTTTYSQSWSEYTDKAKNFVNYVWKDPVSANALFVLDGGLQTIGSIDNLAPGEQVQSVRFDGPTGYIVTFHRVDPLFAVDLSDPSKPAVKSALKIPGFSQYLHVYGDGRLFGLGMDADPDTGRTDGMKLTMFDTTNPEDVTVKNSLKLSTDYSNALYNHKAILISVDKGLIAFPADSGYDVYTYSDEQGFVKQASIPAVDWNGDNRGLYIGDAAYIVSSGTISVLDMTGFKLLNKISY